MKQHNQQPYLIAIILTIFIASCTPTNTPNNHTTETITPPPPSDTIRLPLSGTITTLDPGSIGDVTTMEVASQLFVALTQFDPHNYTPQPALAESWQRNESGTVYQFKLRDDAKWSNGKPITANDVVWTIKRNLAVKNDGPYTFALFVLRNGKEYHQGAITDFSQVGVKAQGAHTVVFTLQHPASYFPAMVNLWPFRPLPSQTIQQHPHKWTQPEHIVTSGPYLLKSWERGKKVSLTRNATFFAHNTINIKNIDFFIVRESTVGLSMYEQGELDVMGGNFLPLPQKAMTRISQDPALNKRFHHQPDFCTYFYGFNTKKIPTDNPLVRKAIAAAINKELLIKLVTKGGEQPAYTFTRPPIFGSVDPKEGIGIHFNPKQAQQWLAKAGYPDGKGFPGITLTHNISETHAAIAQAIKTMLEHYLHIRVTIKQLDWDSYNHAIKTETATNMFRYGWCADYPDANNWLNDLFNPDTSSNLIHWNNRQFADIIDRAKQEKFAARRQKLYQQAERLLNETDAAIVPISFATAAYLVQPRVKNWFHMALGGQQIGQWSLADQDETKEPD
ncbi:MAG: peptide ABC transporter substrate-binding protein [Mariprofundales bacterium]